MSEIVFQKQPNNSTCGQTCIAMALGLPVERVIAVVGHAKGTLNSERAEALEKLGWNASPVKPLRSVSDLPEMALVRVCWRRRSSKSKDGYASRGFRNRGHIVLWANGTFYDPTFGAGIKDWSFRGGKAVEFVAISKKENAKVLSVVESAFAALPELHICPRCDQLKSKTEFGMRVVKKDVNGSPLKAVRQSYCRDCR